MRSILFKIFGICLLVVTGQSFAMQQLSNSDATKQYLEDNFKQYSRGLENQDINTISELWSDQADSTLIIPSSDHPIRGKEKILAFTKKNFSNFKKISFKVDAIQTDVDLNKNIAHMIVEQHLQVQLKEKNAFLGKKIPTLAIINIEFVRSNGSSNEPSSWKITRWTEVFPYSQF